MERSRIIDVYERRAFRTIYEAINWCVGTDYKYWGRACWPNGRPTDGFRMWFTQLAHVEKGRYVPSVNQCLNIICSGGNYHVFDDYRKQGPDEMWKQSWKYDIIFSKEPGGFYYFRGVFVEDKTHSKLHHYVSRRVATKVRFIGCPARRLELLDLVKDDVKFDDDYLTKRVESLDVVDARPSVKTSSQQRQKMKTQEVVTRKPVQEPIINGKELFPNGCKVRHRSFGAGTVKSVTKGIVIVIFSNGDIKEFDVKFCVKNNLLERIS